MRRQQADGFRSLTRYPGIPPRRPTGLPHRCATRSSWLDDTAIDRSGGGVCTLAHHTWAGAAPISATIGAHGVNEGGCAAVG